MDKRKWSSRALLVATLAAVALVGPSVAARAQEQGAAPAAPVTLPVGPRPESITKGWDGKFFVSIQGAPDLGLNDGQIGREVPGEVRMTLLGASRRRWLGWLGGIGVRPFDLEGPGADQLGPVRPSQRCLEQLDSSPGPDDLGSDLDLPERDGTHELVCDP